MQLARKSVKIARTSSGSQFLSLTIRSVNLGRKSLIVQDRTTVNKCGFQGCPPQPPGCDWFPVAGPLVDALSIATHLGRRGH